MWYHVSMIVFKVFSKEAVVKQVSGPAPSPGGGEETVEDRVQGVPSLQQEDVLWKRTQQAQRDAFRDDTTCRSGLRCKGVCGKGGVGSGGASGYRGG